MWPTPNTLDGMSARDPETVADWNNARDGRTGRNTLANLRQAVLDPKYQEKFPSAEIWPTPLARDWKGPDHTREANRTGRRHSGVDLASAVDKRNWPTPMAGPIHDQDGGGHGGVKLAEAATEASVNEPGPRGQLNPDWVEWLMGWPISWTSKEPLSPEAFDHWVHGMLDQSWWAQEPPGIPRIALGVPNRVSRLKAIGNGQVSLCAAWAVLALFEMERQIIEGSKSLANGPPEVDFFDFVNW